MTNRDPQSLLDHSMRRDWVVLPRGTIVWMLAAWGLVGLGLGLTLGSLVTGVGPWWAFPLAIVLGATVARFFVLPRTRASLAR
ncbi:MAG: hypothetical protein R3F30_16690, partial [Planctomycetota bacterium]